MNAVLSEVRELLQQFERSDWRDLYLRTELYSLFIAKAGGAANPMLKPSGPALSPVQAETHVFVAPHVGTVISVLDAGLPVEPGAVVSQIQVLDEVFDIQSDRRGIIDAVLAPIDTLVEYETPLVRIRGSDSSGGVGPLHE